MLIHCDTCGREFERRPTHIHPHNYCSRKCLGAANAQRYLRQRLGQCSNCGKTIEIAAGHKKRNQHFFCGKECAWNYKVKKNRSLL